MPLESMKPDWSQLYDQEHQPSLREIDTYISNGLWRQMNAFLQETYTIQPKMAYSKCTGQPGWNVKYQKGGKSLCTLYPLDGYFIALVVIGAKEVPETELLLPLCTEYTRSLYNNIPFACGGKWLMMEITNDPILSDAQNLIKLRVKPKQK